MDVLRPVLMYVNGRCYRINNPDLKRSESRSTGVEWDDYPSNYGNECTGEEPCDVEEEDFNIIMTDNGRYKTSFHVARTYYAPIIGAKGQTRKRLEDETKTIIKVPRQPQDNDILITGASKKAVASARRKIHLMVLSYRRKQQFTHFLSVPMVTPSVKKRFLLFKDQVLRNCRTRGVDESIFQNPDKLHLTLCMLVLNDSVERSEAARVLESCKKEVIDPLMEGNLVTILLSGIEYMNDDPSEVNVLYAKVHANNILQKLVDKIVDYCAQADLIDKQYESVKLHVTIMKTKYYDTKPGDYGKSKTRETFNALPVLEKFGEFEFGEVTIDTIHLSTRFSISKTNGYYQSTTRISLTL